MTTSQEILKWLDENKDWFKPSAICKKLKIDKGNFSRYMKTEIPEKYLIDIMHIIMPLGFTLDEVIKENNKPEVKAKILAERNKVPEQLMGQRIYTPDNGSINKDDLPDYVAKVKSERIAQLEKELKNIPNNLKIPKKLYISLREKELAELKSKLK